MAGVKSLSEVFGTTVSTPERAAAVERQRRLLELENRMAAEEGGADEPVDLTEDVESVEAPAPEAPVREEHVVTVPPAPHDDTRENIIVQNNKIPVQFIVNAGKNIMSGADTKFVVSVEAHDVQVNDDFISVLFKRTFTMTPPSFTQMSLVVRSVRYDVMCIGGARSLGSLSELNFVIVTNPTNGETSNS